MRIWHGSVGDRIHVGDETARRGLALGYEDHGSPGFGGSNDSSLRILSVCSHCPRPPTSARHVVSLPRDRDPEDSSASHAPTSNSFWRLLHRVCLPIVDALDLGLFLWRQGRVQALLLRAWLLRKCLWMSLLNRLSSQRRQRRTKVT